MEEGAGEMSARNHFAEREVARPDGIERGDACRVQMKFIGKTSSE